MLIENWVVEILCCQSCVYEHVAQLSHLPLVTAHCRVRTNSCIVSVPLASFSLIRLSLTSVSMSLCSLEASRSSQQINSSSVGVQIENI
jgi:hypothetical protein